MRLAFLTVALATCDSRPVEPGGDAALIAAALSASPTVSATATSSTQVTITWTDNSTNETGFEIHRATGGGLFTVLTRTRANTTSYGDTGLQPGQMYCYTVRAFRTVGHKTTTYAPLSAPACATTPAPPAAPSSADATPVSSSAVDLTWIDNSGNEDGFRIERSAASGGPWQAVASTGPNTAAYRDVGLASGQQLCYRVIAFNAHGNSSPSNADCATPADPLPALTNLTASTADRGILLSWTDNGIADDVNELHRSTDGATFTLWVMIAGNSTTYQDVGAMNTAVTYWYRLRARKDAAFSAFSNVASAAGSMLQPPEPPTFWEVRGYYLGSAWLSWENIPGTADSFKIERCDQEVCGDADFRLIATVDANTFTMTYNDYGLADWTIYTYRIRGVNQAGESAPSNLVQGRTCIEEVDWESPCFPPLPSAP